ncbi:preprotein translocase subunit SecE [Brachybacterium phenoliresistens]|uniref:Protein translocase subunit SecE n=1 Tax=Brachybacterium phenoliresistens TaxID=396014 RepID=Z9JUE8_9MICO|nr:preprotein translocase subunit SecE [Brachybacterium phenoliresistens]EWS81985.1 preprotein translocase subunit SecE [Brachybacterium phenoliresistens]
MSASQQHPETAERGRGEGSSNPFLAIGLFIRQVIAELKKVVVPTRKELVVYSITVLCFVFAMILLVFGLDFAFGWLARFTFVVPDQGL